MSDIYFRMSRMEQRISNMIRQGYVAEVQVKPPRVKIAYDVDDDDKPILSAWLRYFEERMGHVRTSNPPKEGEQAMIISANGDLKMGVVLLGLATSDNPAASDDFNQHVSVYDDGSMISYDRKAHALAITIASGTATLNAQTFYINGDIEHDGTYHTTKTVTADKDITSKVNINDKTGSMMKMRKQYNGHKHGNSSVPDASMS